MRRTPCKTQISINFDSKYHNDQTACADMYAMNAAGFLVCMKTVPGPVFERSVHLYAQLISSDFTTYP
jgi:hypothetical protein